MAVVQAAMVGLGSAIVYVSGSDQETGTQVKKAFYSYISSKMIA